MKLAADAGGIVLSPREHELQRLRAYLLEWKAYQEAYRPRQDAPDTASFLVGADCGVSTASEWLERSDEWAMEVIEKAIHEDLLKHPDGEAMRASLLTRLLNVSLPARVFRHGRLLHLPPAEVDAMADRAEATLVSIVKVYGLPLHT